MAKKGNGAGGGLMLLLVLLLGAGGAGAWNYQRNLELEKQEQDVRPFKGYSDQDLAALAEGYRQEIETLERRYRATRGTRTTARDEGLIGERVNEYERVRRSNDRIREATAELAQQEARLAEITAEQRHRGQMTTQSLMVHLGRLTKI